MADIVKVTDPQKIVTDPVVLKVLAEQGIDKDYVELWHDYAPKNTGQENSPFAKFYRDLVSGRKLMVVSGLPMVAASGQAHELAWHEKNGVFESGNNLFRAVVDRGTVRLIALNDQPATKKDDEVTYHPQLFIGGVEVSPVSPSPELLDADPVNVNYQYNVLEWDYGVCRRRLRLIEGRFLGAWVFPSRPGGDASIRYNQSGDFKLKLGQFRVNDDEEVITLEDFDKMARFGGYPVVINDSATFYPDANPESASVDGTAYRSTSSEAWSSIISGAGTTSRDTNANDLLIYISSSATTDQWDYLFRGIFLFDTSSLPDGALISAATLSIYGSNKADEFSPAITPNINIYSSNPASNTALVPADYGTLGSTAFSAAISYAGWNTSGYNDFALNSSGLAAISKTGVSKFGARNASYDVASSAPTWKSASDARLDCYFADQGSGYKPKLVVTYTDNTKTSSETGSGAEGHVLAAALAVVDAGTGVESGGFLHSLSGSDGGEGYEALKTLIKTAGSSSDIKLSGRPGQVGMPNKGVNL